MLHPPAHEAESDWTVNIVERGMKHVEMELPSGGLPHAQAADAQEALCGQGILACFRVHESQRWSLMAREWE